MDGDMEKADQSNQAADSEQESSTLEAVEAKMAALRGEGTEDSDDPQLVNDEKVDSPDSTDLEVDDSNKEEEVDDSDKEEADNNSVMLPSGHRRAALARGYTNEEIEHYLEIKPDEAVARFRDIFDDWQKENARWSERGRQLAAVDQRTSEKSKDEGKTQETSTTLPHYDTKALIEEHGNEDLINALVGPLNAVIDRVNDAAGKLSKSEGFLRETEENALTDATQEFLKSDEMKSFRNKYGTEIKDLTEEQVKSRLELFGQADIIVAGARDHGVDITVQDALERAHILVSQGTRDEAIRQDIRDSMKKRTKTTKSSHQRMSTSDANQPVSDEELVKRTEAKLKALRNRT